MITVETALQIAVGAAELLGADVTVLYREQDFVDVVEPVDVVLDNMGASYLARNVQVLAPGGRLVVIGLQGGARADLDLGALLTLENLKASRDALQAQVGARPIESAAAFFANDGRPAARTVVVGGPRPVFEPLEVFVGRKPDWTGPVAMARATPATAPAAPVPNATAFAAQP